MLVTCGSVVRRPITWGEGYRAYLEANLLHGINIEEQTTIKDKGGFAHAIIDRLPVDCLKLLPLGGDDHCFSSLASLKCGVEDRDSLFDYDGQSVVSKQKV